MQYRKETGNMGLVVLMLILIIGPTQGAHLSERLRFRLTRVQADRKPQAILVKFEARNDGDKTITFSKFGLPLVPEGVKELLGPGMLQVTYENCHARDCAEKYYGLIALRHPGRCGSEGADCVTLQPGESVSHTINLVKHYGFERVGKYYVQVGGRLMDHRLDEEEEDASKSSLAQSQLIISNRVMIDIKEKRPVSVLGENMEPVLAFCADDMLEGARYDCGKQMGMGTKVEWTVQAKSDASRMSVSLNGYGNLVMGWSKVSMNGMENDMNVLQDGDVHQVTVGVNRDNYEILVDGKRVLFAPVLRTDVLENEERGFGEKIVVDVKEMSGMSAKYLRGDWGSPPVEDAPKARGEEEKSDLMMKKINPCADSLDQLGNELQDLGVSGAVGRSRMTQDVRMSFVNADGESETEKVAHVTKRTLALVGHTSSSMSKMLKYTHKILRTKKNMVLIYGDNTVVTAKLPSCEISHIYFPTSDGSLNPEISKTLGSRLSVAVDKPSKKKPGPAPRPAPSPVAAKYKCGSGKTIALSFSKCGQGGTPSNGVLSSATESASNKVHSKNPLRDGTYFGSGGSWSRVDNTYNNMKAALCQTGTAAKSIHYKCLPNGQDPQNLCRSNSNTVAYVRTGNRNPLNIHICAHMNKFSANTKMGVVVHELAHFRIIGAAADVAYGCDKSKKLSTNDKRRNADNYRFNVEGCPTPAPVCVSAKSIIRAKREKSDEIYEKELGDVSVGDVIETVNGFENVWYIVDGGKMGREMVSLSVKTSGSSVGEKMVWIELTAEHLLFGEGGSMKRADSFVVGDGVEMFVNGGSVMGVVSSVTRSRGKVLSVVTHSGEFLLSNGIRVSSYSHSARFAKVIHMISWPFRWMSRLVEKNVGQYVIDALSIDKIVNPGAVVGSLLVG